MVKPTIIVGTVISAIGLLAGVSGGDWHSNPSKHIDSMRSSSSQKQTNDDAISLEEGVALIKKAGAEEALNGAEIISSNNHTITIGSEVGAKGYDKTTLTPNDDGTVHIHQEYGTLDGGTYSILDYMPAKEFNVTR